MTVKKRPKRKMSSIQWSPKKMRRMLFVIALFIIPPFVLWGVSSAIRSERQYRIGKIGHQTIVLPIWRRAFEHMQAEMSLRYGQNARQMYKPQDLKPMAWERLMLLYDAKRKHIKATDDEVAQKISEYEFLKGPDGKISMQAYSNLVRSIGLNEKEFEELIREDLIIRKLFDSITKGVSITDQEIRDAFLEKEEKISFLYDKVLNKDFIDKVEVEDKEIEEYYQEHKDDYLEPVSIKVKYLEISLPNVKKITAVEKKDIENYYKTHSQEFTGKKLSDVEEQIYAKLEERNAKERMDKIVEWFSKHKVKDLDVSAKKFGLSAQTTPFYSARKLLPQLGWIPPFYTKAFSMDVNQVSDVFDYKDSYYVFQVIEKKDAHIPDLAQIKDRVESDLKRKKASDLAKEQAEKLRKEVLDKISSGTDKQEAFKAVFPNAQEAKDISRTSYVPGIGMAKGFFEDIAEEEISEPIKTPDGWIIALKTQHIVPSEEDFEKQKDSIKQELLNQKKDKVFADYERELYNKVQITIYKENY